MTLVRQLVCELQQFHRKGRLFDDGNNDSRRGRVQLDDDISSLQIGLDSKPAVVTGSPRWD
jgi:hypothetical protein